MNKVLHGLVYLFLLLAAAGLWFELQLNQKRDLLTERNRMQEEYLIKIARTIEQKEADKSVTSTVELDVSPVEAKIVDTPDMDNLLSDYNAYLETSNLDTFDWSSQKTKEQLRQVYALDAEGKPIPDGNRFLMSGVGTEDELLNTLFNAATLQQAKLNSTRAELVKLRGKLDEVTSDFNRMKPEARQDKVTIVEKTEKISKLEDEKSELENQIVKIKAQIDELNAEITSLKDEVVTAKDETEVAKEELEKSQKMVDQLKKLLRDTIATSGSATAAAQGTAVTALPTGDKGRIVDVDNDSMFAVVEFTDETMKEMKGENLDRPLPALELGVKRGDDFVGRVRIRQEVKGRNFVIVDILSAWEQDKIAVNDTVYSD